MGGDGRRRQGERGAHLPGRRPRRRRRQRRDEQPDPGDRGRRGPRAAAPAALRHRHPGRRAGHRPGARGLPGGRRRPSQELVTFEGGDAPLTAVLLVDSSESMRGERLASAGRGPVVHRRHAGARRGDGGAVRRRDAAGDAVHRRPAADRSSLEGVRGRAAARRSPTTCTRPSRSSTAARAAGSWWCSPTASTSTAPCA